jgi:hypothetical protein
MLYYYSYYYYISIYLSIYIPPYEYKSDETDLPDGIEDHGHEHGLGFRLGRPSGDGRCLGVEDEITPQVTLQHHTLQPAGTEERKTGV